MATSLGELAVNVTARTDRFGKNIRKAQRDIRTFSAIATTSISRVSAIFGALGVVVPLSTAALVSGITRVIESIDKLGKTSSKLGVLPDQLAGLQHAAAQTGVSTETFNMALQRMTRRVAEAAKDTGEAKDALKELGLSAAALNNLPLEQKLFKIANAFRGVTNQADRVRLAMKLFDSEGVALVNTLALGERGLKAFIKEAKELGIAFNQEQVERAAAFADAMDKLKKALGGSIQGIVIEMAPGLTNTIELLTFAVQELKRLESKRVGLPSVRRSGGDPLNTLRGVGAGIGTFIGNRAYPQNLPARSSSELMRNWAADNAARYAAIDAERADPRSVRNVASGFAESVAEAFRKHPSAIVAKAVGNSLMEAGKEAARQGRHGLAGVQDVSFRRRHELELETRRKSLDAEIEKTRRQLQQAQSPAQNRLIERNTLEGFLRATGQDRKDEKQISLLESQLKQLELIRDGLGVFQPQIVEFPG